MKARYPELDIDNEDAYYDQAGRMMDEYEGMEKAAAGMRAGLEKSPLLMDMVLAARQASESGGEFDPIVYLAENRGLDLEALKTDEEYMKKVAEASAKYLDKMTSARKIAEAQRENFPASAAAVQAKAQELGLSDEQAQEIIGRMFDVMDGLILGRIDIGAFEMFAKGQGADAAAEQARAEGKAEGLSARVQDRLRNLRPDTQPGQQRPARERKPAEEIDNPFIA